MDDFNEGVRLREGKEPKERENTTKVKANESKILDEDEQQKIIDDLKKEYGSVIQSQKRFFRIVTVALSIVCIIVGFMTNLFLPFIPSSMAFLLLLGFEKIQNMQCKVASGICEISFLILTFKYWGKAPSYLWIAFHCIYFIMVFYLRSSRNFANAFPEQIQKLQNMKYGPKLA